MRVARNADVWDDFVEPGVTGKDPLPEAIKTATIRLNSRAEQKAALVDWDSDGRDGAIR